MRVGAALKAVSMVAGASVLSALIGMGMDNVIVELTNCSNKSCSLLPRWRHMG
jgi:hypothetical protein